MRISFVKASGFRGIKESIDISFPSGFAVISGRNGSGKSTICDAIEFALTGILEKHYLTEKGEDISDYLWWRGTGRPSERYVSIGIVDIYGREVIITRGPKGLIDMNEGDVKRILCDPDSAPEESLKQLCRTSILRDETITQMSVDLPEVDRFTFVKSAIGSRDFGPLEERMKTVVEILKAQSETLEKDYHEARDRISTLTANLSEAKSQAAQSVETAEAERTVRDVTKDWEDKITDLLSKARHTVLGFREEAEDLAEIMRGLLQSEKRRHEIETPEFIRQKGILESKIEELRPRLNEISQESLALSQQIETERQGQAMLGSLAELAEHGSRIGLQEGKCPLCGSIVSENNFSEHIKKIRELVGSRANFLLLLVEKRAVTDLKEKELRRELESVVMEFRRVSEEAEVIEGEFLNHVNQLKRYRFAPPPGSNYPEMLRKEIEERRRKILILEKGISTLESSRTLERILELERDLDVAKEEWAAIDERLAHLRVAESRASRAYSNIRRVLGEIVDERLAELSPLFNELFSRLRPHVDWPEIGYHIRGDIRKFLSFRVGEDLNPRFLFSSGQRRAAGLAFLLAVHLSRSWCQLRTLILDDPVHHIDDFRALNLVELLAAIRRSGQQLICTTEDSALADLLCRRLRSSETDEGCLIDLEYKAGEGVKVASCRQIYPFPAEVILSA